MKTVLTLQCKLILWDDFIWTWGKTLWELIFQIGPMYTCLEALKYMSKNNSGHGGVLVNIASVAGLDVFG